MRVGLSFLVGRTPKPSVRVSEIADTIGRNIPDILESQIHEAIKSKRPDEDVLDWLSQSMSWNYSISQPSVVHDSDNISAVAFKLFSQYVAGADQLVEWYQRTSEQHILTSRSQDPNWRDLPKHGASARARVGSPGSAYVRTVDRRPARWEWVFSCQRNTALVRGTAVYRSPPL